MDTTKTCVFGDRQCPAMDENTKIESCPLAIKGELGFDYTGGGVKKPEPKTMCSIQYIARILYSIGYHGIREIKKKK